MVERIRILSTKKLRPDIAEAIQNRADLSLTEVDFIRIAPQPFDCSVMAQNAVNPRRTAIVFTSVNAVKYAAACFPDPKAIGNDVFCLEGATRAQVAQTFGEAGIRGTAGDAAALAREIIGQKAHDAVTFFCGDRRRDELPQILRGSDVDVREVVVYTTSLTPCKIAGMQDAVMFFSPSAVDSFFSGNRLHPATICFAVGATTAAAVREKSAGSTVIIARRPDQEAMLGSLLNYFQKASIDPTT